MTRVIVSLLGGASLGGTYALIGLGLVLAFRATATFNFAHGELMLLPALIVAKLETTHGLSFGPSVLVAVVIGAAIAVAFYYLVLQRTTGMPHFMGIIATLGLAAILDGAIALKYGSSDYNLTIPFLPKGVVKVFGARVTSTSLVLTAFTLGLAFLVIAVTRWTQFGTQLRAAGQDAVLASQGGIHVRRLHAISWAVAAALAAIAGLTYGAVNVTGPSMTNVALLAFPAILLGGLDSIEGALVGGLLTGIAQGFITTYLGGQVVDVLTYLALLLVLIIRPRGLFGSEAVARV